MFCDRSGILNPFYPARAMQTSRCQIARRLYNAVHDLLIDIKIYDDDHQVFVVKLTVWAENFMRKCIHFNKMVPL